MSDNIPFLKTFHLLIFLNILVPLNSQSILDKEVSVHIADMPLSTIIDSISQKNNINFSFNSSLEVFQKTKSLDQNGKLRLILKNLLIPENLDFELINNLIVIYLKKDTLVVSPMLTKTQVINGRVVDFDSGTPLPYATVHLAKDRKGIVTNEFGNFQLKRQFSEVDDTLLVSYVGFHKYQVTINSMTDTLLDIQMMKSPISIDPVTITYYQPIEIIKKVTEKYFENYTDQPKRLLAFFRETTLRNGRYQYVCEALLDIYKSSYSNTFRSDRASILKGRKITFDKEEARVKYKLEGGIYNTLLLDIVKESAHFLLPENFDKYDYKFVQLLHDQDREIIVITFDQKQGIDQPLFSGNLYIDNNDYALVSAEFGISEAGMKLASNILVKKHSRSLKVRPVKASYRVNYSKLGSKYLLDNITGEVEIEVKEKLFSSKKYFKSVTELVVTDVDSVNIVIPKRSQSVNISQVLSENLEDFEPDFWGEANIIVPGQKLNDAITQYRYQQLIEKIK